MPLENPFRSVPPKELDPNQEEFLRKFGGADDEGLKAAGVTGDGEGRMMNDGGLDGPPIDFVAVASDAEKEAYENDLVECAGVYITRKEETSLKNLLAEINRGLAQDHQVEAALGKEVALRRIVIGGKTKEQMLDEMIVDGIYFSSDIKQMVENESFKMWEQPEWVLFISISLEKLGFPKGASYDQIQTRAAELGLEICPPETGPQYALSHTEDDFLIQPYIFMEEIRTNDNRPCIFGFNFDNGDEPSLVASPSVPDRRFIAGYHFVFRVSKTPKKISVS